MQGKSSYTQSAAAVPASGAAACPARSHRSVAAGCSTMAAASTATWHALGSCRMHRHQPGNCSSRNPKPPPHPPFPHRPVHQGGAGHGAAAAGGAARRGRPVGGAPRLRPHGRHAAVRAGAGWSRGEHKGARRRKNSWSASSLCACQSQSASPAWELATAECTCFLLLCDDAHRPPASTPKTPAVFKYMRAVAQREPHSRERLISVRRRAECGWPCMCQCRAGVAACGAVMFAVGTEQWKPASPQPPGIIGAGRAHPQPCRCPNPSPAAVRPHPVRPRPLREDDGHEERGGEEGQGRGTAHSPSTIAITRHSITLHVRCWLLEALGGNASGLPPGGSPDETATWL